MLMLPYSQILHNPVVLYVFALEKQQDKLFNEIKFGIKSTWPTGS